MVGGVMPGKAFTARFALAQLEISFDGTVAARWRGKD
jgi:hypothetical protein